MNTQFDFLSNDVIVLLDISVTGVTPLKGNSIIVFIIFGYAKSFLKIVQFLLICALRFSTQYTNDFISSRATFIIAIGPAHKSMPVLLLCCNRTSCL